jgi:hypothetical protein
MQLDLPRVSVEKGHKTSIHDTWFNRTVVRVKTDQNTEVRESGLRDILAVAGGVVIGIVIWIVVLLSVRK